MDDTILQFLNYGVLGIFAFMLARGYLVPSNQVEKMLHELKENSEKVAEAVGERIASKLIDELDKRTGRRGGLS